MKSYFKNEYKNIDIYIHQAVELPQRYIAIFPFLKNHYPCPNDLRGIW